MSQIEMLVATSTASELSRIEQLVEEQKHARKTAASSVAAKVFALPELLEMILFQLSIRQLYRVQRVCRAFKDITERSARLRRHMFLDLERRSDSAPILAIHSEPRLSGNIFDTTTFFLDDHKYQQYSGVFEINMATYLKVKDGRVFPPIFGCDESASWRKTNTCNLDIPIEVKFNWHRIIRSARDVSQAHFLAGSERTMGHLCDLALKVGEHFISMLSAEMEGIIKGTGELVERR